MTTPTIYNDHQLEKVLRHFNNPSIYHQTAIGNLGKILATGEIFSTATLWACHPSLRLAAAKNSVQEQNWATTGGLGFIDYVFASFINGVALKLYRYGTVSLEFSPRPVLERESFVYLFNIQTSWNAIPEIERNSDATSWVKAIANHSTHKNHEILIRRRISLSNSLIKLHCFRKMEGRTRALMAEAKLQGTQIQVHDDPPEWTASMSAKAIINGREYSVLYVDEKRDVVRIFNHLSAEDSEYFGEYRVKADGSILEVSPLTSTEVVVGRISV